MADQQAPFLDETQEVASFFVDLYLSPEPLPTRSPHIPQKRLGNQLSVQVDSEGEAITPTGEIPLPSSLPRKDGATPEDPASPSKARLIAERLKVIGDSMERQVQQDVSAYLMEQLKSQSVYQITLPIFKTMCRSVLNRCSGYVTSGWQQVSLVYMSMGHLVREVRRESGPLQSSPAPREVQLEGFVGQALKDLKLDQWIAEQGGMDPEKMMVTTDQPKNIVSVPIEGTSVDV